MAGRLKDNVWELAVLSRQAIADKRDATKGHSF
jgi:hypothetical protein